MTINIINHYRSLNDIPSREIEACRNGRFYHWRRVYIVKTDNDITVLSLTILNRMVKTLQELFGGDYFARVLKSKNVVLLAFVEGSRLSNTATIPSPLSYYFPEKPKKPTSAVTTLLPNNSTQGTISQPPPTHSSGNKTTPPPVVAIDQASIKTAYSCAINGITLSDADLMVMVQNMQQLFERKKFLYGDLNKLTISDTELEIFHGSSIDYDQRKTAMPILLNYLVLTRQIVAYCLSSSTYSKEYTLFFTQTALQESKVDQPKHPDYKTLRTFALLSSMESKLSAFSSIAAPPYFGFIEQELLEKTQRELLQYHRSRILEGKRVSVKLPLGVEYDKQQLSPEGKVLDFLLEKGRIAQWNYSLYPKNFYVKFDEKDSVPSCRLEWNAWRDLQEVQRDNQDRDHFLKNNRIVVRAGITPPLDKDQLLLIEQLNRRSEHGPVQWLRADGANPALAERLKQLGLIYGYWNDETIIGNYNLRTFHVYAKQVDIPPTERAYVK